MRFGANYTPSQHWWHVWLDFDTPGVVDGIRRDPRFKALLREYDHKR